MLWYTWFGCRHCCLILTWTCYFYTLTLSIHLNVRQYILPLLDITIANEFIKWTYCSRRHAKNILLKVKKKWNKYLLLDMLKRGGEYNLSGLGLKSELANIGFNEIALCSKVIGACLIDFISVLDSSEVSRQSIVFRNLMVFSFRILFLYSKRLREK